MPARQLVLIRHSKAANGTVDLDRPLTARGGRDAAAIGTWLRQHTLPPDRVVISPARRTLETWSNAAHQLKESPNPVVDERIYENTPDDLLAVIRDMPGKVRVLVLVGHNPSMELLAGMLAEQHADRTARSVLRRGYPTSGVAVFEVDGPFAELTAGSSRLDDFAAPRDGELT